MEYIPSNLNMLIHKNNKNRKNFRHSLPSDLCSPGAGPVTPLLTIKLCMYQIFRALAYIHSLGICHRDIKPNNLLFDPETGVLKICDFGSAKHLRRGESHVSYICARFYRAPELLFGATDYNEKIDLWSTGVVFSELLLGQPIFHEHSGLDQLVLIISKLGTPTKEQIKAMNQKYAKYDFPHVYSQSWESLFPCAPTDAIDLISRLFQYDPSNRIAPMQACAHQFFNELRQPNKKWFNKDLPPLFNFTKYELSIDPSINDRLLPYKAKPSPMNNITYLQQQPSQALSQATSTSSMLIHPSNQRIIGQQQQSNPSTLINSQPIVSSLTGNVNARGSYPSSNFYPNQNFPYHSQSSMAGQHYNPNINHHRQAMINEMFSQGFIGPNKTATVNNNNGTN
ncbi:hypothetical protein SSS_03940 [Sarcoptes scabiei]|nr:hypothetical protein SSS_03940 [Sarcoptes scabiei]